MKDTPWLIILVLILLLGTAVRVYNISNVPPGFFADEVPIGINAYTILTKGTDYQGDRFPLIFKAFNSYISSVAVYATVPFVALFGLTEKAVRLTSASFGIISILAIYFVTKCLFKDNPKRNMIASFSAFFLAISPWHIHFSRIGWDGFMSGIMLVLIGLYVFLKAQENPKLLPLSVLIFGVSLYTYNPIKMFVPLFGLGLFFIYFKFFWENKKMVFISALLLFAVLYPLAHDFSSSGLVRWNQVSIFSSPPQERTIFSHIAHNYLSHFSMDFLFFKGDTDMMGQIVTRHSIRGIGELYLFQLPFIILGFFILWKKPYRNTLAIMSLWLLLYPLGSAVSNDLNAQATRSLIGVIPFQILAAIGLGSLFSYKSKFEKKNIVILIVTSIIIMLSFSHFLELYFVEYPTYSYGFYGWQFGARDILQYFMTVEADYDDLVMGGDFNAPEIFIPFYSQNNKKGCSKCIVGSFQGRYNPERKQLFAVNDWQLKEFSYNSQFEKIKDINYPDGKPYVQIGIVRKVNST